MRLGAFARVATYNRAMAHQKAFYPHPEGLDGGQPPSILPPHGEYRAKKISELFRRYVQI
jgi:hypothetical protein